MHGLPATLDVFVVRHFLTLHLQVVQAHESVIECISGQNSSLVSVGEYRDMLLRGVVARIRRN